MMYLMQALKIAILVTAGAIFVLHLPKLSKFVKGEYKNMNKAVIAGKVMKWVGGFGSILGFAFFFGSFQAYVQGLTAQILPLGVAGILCLIAGIISFVFGIRKVKRAE